MVRLASLLALVIVAPTAAAADVPDAPKVALSGYVQADLIPWDEASRDELDDVGRPLNRERALIRRGRLRAEIERGRTFATFEVDGNTIDGPTARIVGAQVGARWRDEDRDVEGRVAAGLFKIPFGREVPSPEAERAVLEPTTAARALFPGNYDAGVMASGRWRALELTVALTNGAPSGDTRFRGRDPLGSWELVGRVGAHGELRHGVTLGGGVSAITGSGLHEDAITTAVETFERSAVGADVELGWCLCVLGKGKLSAELVRATNLDRAVEYADPIAAGRDLRELGWHVQVVQALSRHAQVAARWESYRPDRDEADPRYRVISVAAEAHREGARLMLQFDRETSPDGGESDRVTLRGQVRF